MRRTHERQPCRLPPTLPTTSPEDLRPTHCERERDHGTRVGQAEGQRRASWRRGCWAQPPPGHRRTGDQGWRLCRTRSWGQHPTAAFDFPGSCWSILARRPGPPPVVQEHCRWHQYPHLDGDQWVESKESLVPMKVAPAKGRAYGQRLKTSLRTIHKAVMDGTRESWPASRKRKSKTKWEL